MALPTTADGALRGLEVANDETELSPWFCPSCTYMSPPLVRHCPMCDAANPRWIAQQKAYAAVEAAAAAREASKVERIRAKEAASARRDALVQDLEDDFADFSGDDEEQGVPRSKDQTGPGTLHLPSTSIVDSGSNCKPTGALQGSPRHPISQQSRRHSASPGSCHIDTLPLDLLLQALAFVGHPSSLARFRAVTFCLHVVAESPILWQAPGEAAAALNSKPAQGWRRDQILLFQARPLSPGGRSIAEDGSHSGSVVPEATTSASSNTRGSAGTTVTSYEQLGQLLSRANATLEHASDQRAAAISSSSTVVPQENNSAFESLVPDIDDSSASSSSSSSSSNTTTSTSGKRREVKASTTNGSLSAEEDDMEPCTKRTRFSQDASTGSTPSVGGSSGVNGSSGLSMNYSSSSCKDSIQRRSAGGNTSSSTSSAGAGATSNNDMHATSSGSNGVSTSPLPAVALQTGVGGVAAAVARAGGADWYFVARQASTGRLLLAAWQSLSEGWKWVQGALHRLLWACLDNCAKSTTTTTSAAASSAASGGHGASSSSSSSSDMTKRYSRLSAAAATAEIAKDVNFNGDRFEARASAVHRASSQRIKLIRCGTLPAADEELLPPDQRAVFARTAHKLQRINWSLLRTSLLVTMSHVAEGFARYALLAPPTSSSFSSSFSPAEAVQGREGGAISEEATAASHGSSSSSSSSSSNSNDTLGARCAWCWRAYRSWLSGVVGLLGDLEAYLGGERDRDLAMRRPPMPSLADSGVSAFRHAFLLRPPLFRRLMADLLPSAIPSAVVDGVPTNNHVSSTSSDQASLSEVTTSSTPASTALSSSSSLAYHADTCAGSFTNAELGSSYKVLTFVLSQAQTAYKDAVKSRASHSSASAATRTTTPPYVQSEDVEGVLKLLQAADGVGDGEVAPISIPLGSHSRPAAVAYGVSHPVTNDNEDDGEEGEGEEGARRRDTSARLIAEREHSQRIIDGLGNGVRGMLRRKLLLPLWAQHQEYMHASGALNDGSRGRGRPLKENDDDDDDDEDEAGEAEGNEGSDLLLSGFRQTSSSAHRRKTYCQRKGRR